MVVIVIIGLVSTITSVAVFDVYRDAQVKTTKVGIRECESALKLYLLRHGKYPETAQGLKVLREEKLIEAMPHDGWRHELVYRLEGSAYTVLSYGADGAPGGTGYDADITSADLE
jgi:general secretion pathway protein G